MAHPLPGAAPLAEVFPHWGKTWGYLNPGGSDSGEEFGDLFDCWWTVRIYLVYEVGIHKSYGVLDVECKDLVVGNIGDSRGSRNGKWSWGCLC